MAFKRAEYVRELVPIVLDDKQDVRYRAQCLRSLLETKSVDAYSAVGFGQKLLDSRVPGTLPSTPRYNVQEEGYFIDTMIKAMPEGLPALLDEYHRIFIRAGAREGGKGKGLGDPAYYFWRILFHRTVRRYTDSELRVLNDERFLANYFEQLYDITDETSREEAEEWVKRQVKGLRILGAIHVLQDSREADAQAVAEVQAAIDPPHQQPDAVELATEILKILDQPYVVSVCRSLSKPVLEIILRRDLALESMHLEGERRLRDHYYAAQEYLLSCASPDQLEPAVLPIVRKFYEQLKKTPPGTPLQLGYPEDERLSGNYPIEWTLIRLLMKMSRGSEGQRLLSDIFSLPDEKLRQGGLDVLAEEWRKSQSGEAPVARPATSR